MTDYLQLAQEIKTWGREAGFADLRITDVDLRHVEAGFEAWLAAGYHGEMAYMAAHGSKRSRPDELVPGTIRVISVRMNYLPENIPDDWRRIEQQHAADVPLEQAWVWG